MMMNVVNSKDALKMPLSLHHLRWWSDSGISWTICTSFALCSRLLLRSCYIRNKWQSRN